MELSPEQMRLFINGAMAEMDIVRDGWRDIYGEENPQNALDAMCGIMQEAQRAVCDFSDDQKALFQMMKRSVEVAQ